MINIPLTPHSLSNCKAAVLTLTPRNGERAGLTMPELAEAEEAG
jgi:hypothetical protein